MTVKNQKADIGLAHSVLKEYWSFEDFRPGQAEIISQVLDAKDALALLPTGGGKSICYQVPALTMQGVALVVSPLIALMKDQVGALQQRGIRAAALVSGMSKHEMAIRLDAAMMGKLDLLYVSPERLLTEPILARLDRMPVNLIAVDEAHCISEWGYDFRPAYLQIRKLREALAKHNRRPPVLALTASATRQVQQDITEQLQFGGDAEIFHSSFDRPNLGWIVRHTEQKDARILALFLRLEGSGLVYVRSRRRAKELAGYLQRRGLSVSWYHAGLDAKERAQRQEAWMRNEIRIMVCTSAFGMGIDKPDVRTVVHADVPDSLEAYYQEAGRAGRDGQESWAGLFVSQSDIEELNRRREEDFPEVNQVRQIYQHLGDFHRVAIGSGESVSFDFDITDFSSRFKLSPILAHKALRVLELEGWITLNESARLPSRAMVRANREDLYRFQVERPEYDDLIKAVLRTTPGIFDHYAAIDELQLSRLVQKNATEVRQTLEILTRYELIDFRPRKDSPQLTWLQARHDARRLPLDIDKLKWRKELHAARIDAVLRYADSEGPCRNRIVIEYFGEVVEERCGRCDWCRGQEAGNGESLEERIRRGLQAGAGTLEDLLSAVPGVSEQELASELRRLADKGQVQGDPAVGNLSWRN